MKLVWMKAYIFPLVISSFWKVCSRGLKAGSNCLHNISLHGSSATWNSIASLSRWSKQRFLTEVFSFLATWQSPERKDLYITAVTKQQVFILPLVSEVVVFFIGLGRRCVMFFKRASLPVGAFLLSSGKSLHCSAGLPEWRFFRREISFFSKRLTKSY